MPERCFEETMSAKQDSKTLEMTDHKILRNAILDSFWKLDPRLMIKNPVMFVVEVGAVITLVVLVSNALHHVAGLLFGLQITLWLWFTVLFANFAEAMAEGRGKAQAETLRKARAETEARKLKDDGSIKLLPSSKLRFGDNRLVSVGEFGRGDIRDNKVAGVETYALLIQAEDGIRDKMVTGVQTCA